MLTIEADAPLLLELAVAPPPPRLPPEGASEVSRSALGCRPTLKVAGRVEPFPLARGLLFEASADSKIEVRFEQTRRDTLWPGREGLFSPWPAEALDRVQSLAVAASDDEPRRLLVEGRSGPTVAIRELRLGPDRLELRVTGSGFVVDGRGSAPSAALRAAGPMAAGLLVLVSLAAAWLAFGRRSSRNRGRFRVFLSYRRKDSSTIAGRLHDRLSAAFRRTCVFKDVDSIEYGDDFNVRIAAAIERCHVLVAVVGPAWVTAADETGSRRLDDPRDPVRIEIEAALDRKLPVIPLLVGGASMPSPSELPASLRPFCSRNAARVRDDPDFHRDVDRLIRTLELHAARLTAASA